MVYSSGLSHPSIVELARAGNVQAIAHWLNQALQPYSLRAHVGVTKPGCLRILVDLPPLPDRQKLPSVWQDYVMRVVCHRIWELNSARIEGVRIAARFTGSPGILWEGAVRVVSPARRARQQQSSSLRQQVQYTSRRRKRLKTARSLLMGGPAVAAFVVGGVLGYAKAPVEQTNASASTQPKPDASTQPNRPKTVKAALETVAVVKHKQVANPDDPTVTLMFSGDVTLADAFADAMGKDHSKAFSNMEEYRQADLAMVNLENPLTRATLPIASKQFNFKAEPESVEVLKQGGVDLVTLANNHTMDFQEAGLKETMATLDRAGILHMGAGRDIAEARRPEIIDVKGQRLAYLSYWGNEYSAGENKAGISPILEANIAHDIRAIRNQVDWIIVNYHWGQELAEHPADWQMELARFTIDQGADLIVGHHPHVLQGAEIYRGRPIAYSLGNFIFGGNSRSDYDTAVMRVALKDKQMKVEFLPVEVKNYQPQVVSGDRSGQILKQITDRSIGFQQPMQPSMILDARERPPAPPPPGASPHPAGTSDTTPADHPSVAPDATQPFQQPTTPGDHQQPSSSSPTEPTIPNVQPSLPVDAAPDEPPALPSELAPYSDPAEPIAPDGQQPFAPGNGAPYTDPSQPQVQPSAGDTLPWAEPSPPSLEPDWQNTPAPEGFSSPTESFTNSPDRTPVRSPSSPSESSPDNPFGAPPFEGGGPFPPVSPAPNDTSSTTLQDDSNHTVSDVGSVRQESDRPSLAAQSQKQQRNSEPLPNVALMAPNVW
jgi:poly-gamma-glutamate synthesis protein (capsule biosynthesis protein)